MKKRFFLLLATLIVTSFVIGCTSQGDLPNNEGKAQKFSTEEQKRIDLYVTAMKAAFAEENGGDSFIAVKLDTLEGLSDEAKQEVLNNLKDLSANVYDFEQVKDDKTKFMFEKDGSLRGTIDGSLLYVDLQKYNNNRAVIEGVSWFGNLGAVFPKYKATYRSGKWQLKLISMAIS